jgi:ubiquinone/menaquinone biosynthesis C-methylase UbiE
MTGKIRQEMTNLSALIGTTWEGIATSAGITAGFFRILNGKKAVKLEVFGRSRGYDPEKVAKWFLFAERARLVKKTKSGYLLTPKGALLSHDSKFKDLVGLMQITEFFMKSASHAKETFRKNRSLDSLSEGEVSKDYQPRVSDNLSANLVRHFSNLLGEDGGSLLDIGCGNGNFLRKLAEQYPDVAYSGVEPNKHAVELGRKLLAEQGGPANLTLTVGDARKALFEYPAGSYDWVTAIHLFHFIPKDDRIPLINNMIRIARKGVVMTQSVMELSAITGNADPLMTLLWNDFSGFFMKEEADSINRYIKKKYPDIRFSSQPVMHGASHLVVVEKPL